MQEIEEMLKIPKSTIDHHIQRIGLVMKLDIWIPHKLKEIHFTKHIKACDLHLKRNELDPFSKLFITDDDKWIVQNNVVRKRSWSKCDEPPQITSKAELHQKKIMLSVWWDLEDFVFFELLPKNQTIYSEVHYRQLRKFNEAAKEKWPELFNCKSVIFHHDNATPHTSLASRQKLLRLGHEMMLHPLYSPDLAPPDYYLFRSLENSLNSKTFNDDKAVKSHLVQFFADKYQKFYERGIMKLAERRQKVIKQNEKSPISGRDIP